MLKPFFGGGFDEDACCITATGSFVGTARIASFTNRGQPNEQFARGADENQSDDPSRRL